jgi:hypothetical protein
MFEVNSIVQIIDPDHPWFPCLLVVEEDKGWGVLAYVLVPGSNTENDVGEMCLLFKNEQIAKVGEALVVHQPSEDAE